MLVFFVLYLGMFEVLLPILFLGLFQPSIKSESAVAVLQSLHIAPPAHVLTSVTSTSASGIVIMDAKTGQIVYGKDDTTKRPMASITKLMTALIIAENHDLDEIVQIPELATEIPGQKAYFQAYDQFTVGDVLSALLITSANDAAVALAIHHSGSVDAFVSKMNNRAQTLGLKDTSYANPTGLDGLLQYSTPKDIAWLTLHVLDNPIITERMKKRGTQIMSKRGNVVNLYHTHTLLHSASQLTDATLQVQGGKTGTTNNAKQCLVTVVGSKDNEYIVVLLHSENRYGDLTKLISSLETTRVIGYHSSSR